MRGRRGLLLAVVMLGAGLTGCGLSDSAVNERCLIYSGGVIEDKAFDGFLEPGATAKSTGFGSATHCYRTDQRSYIGQPKGGDAGPVEVVSQDDVRLSVDYQLYFKLNLEDKVLRRFHENLGVKTKAWTDKGWIELLRQYFEPQIERSMEAAALLHDWRGLYANEESRAAFNRDTVGALQRNMAEVIGGDYFCGPSYTKGAACGDFTFTVGKPRPVNGDIVNAIEAEQTSKARTVAQEQENARIRAQIEVERELVALYGADGALLREAIQSGKVQQFIVDQADRSVVPVR